MAVDTLTFIINIIFLIIVGIVALGILIVGLKILFKILEAVFSFASDLVLEALDLIFGTAYFVATIAVAFILIFYFFYLFTPSSLYLDLGTTNHDFEFGVFTLPIKGTYIETSTDYIIRPNFGLPFSFFPGLPVKKTSISHLNLICVDFKKSHPNQPGVITFVPNT